jgi:murein DD-endopeptidase MepM/ murein hydrolase activator NlpD
VRSDIFRYRKTNIGRDRAMKFRIAILVVMAATCGSTWPQSSILLEACNSIPDSSKRLLCLQELLKSNTNLQPRKSPLYLSLKRSFTSLQGGVASGITFKAYQELLLESVKELANFKAENPEANTEAVELLGKSIATYKDAETIWHADIFKAEHRGIGGKGLTYETLGLSPIVKKYELPTETLLLIRTIDPKAAMSKIWGVAERFATAGFNGLEVAQTGMSGATLTQETEPKSVRTTKSVLYEDVNWVWPTSGEVITPFDGQKTKFAMEFGGKPHDPVLAVADGEVLAPNPSDRSATTDRVRNMIVIKHKNGFSSVYMDNMAALVKKGDSVTMGQKISEMGYAESGEVKLTFRILNKGKTVDPISVLGDNKP